MFTLLKFFGKDPDDKRKEDEAVKEALRTKYSYFQKILSTNNQVLEVMADMEEKLSGEYLFDMQYVKTNARLISDEVLKIIEGLNSLSKDKYVNLYKTYADIKAEIENILEHKMEVPVSDLTIPLENLTSADIGIAGGKIAHLGEIMGRLHLPTPDGFVISSYAFVKFMDHNRLTDRIREMLTDLNIENLEEIQETSRKISDTVIQSNVPEELGDSIEDAYTKLCKRVEGQTNVSVRSSAIREDTEFSFAGQYATFLNVQKELISRRYKEVVASLFTPRAIFYSKTKGFSEEEMVMAVGVISMVDATTAGVMYTRNPNSPDADHILINAIYGLGKRVVDGTVTPDFYIVSRHPEGTVIDIKISKQEKMLVCNGEGDIREVDVPEEKRGRQCLSEEQIKTLAGYAIKLEEYYGSPQDIEWAMGSDNRFYILQSRPLGIFSFQPSSQDASLPTRIEGYPIVLDKGIIACKGTGFGKAFILRDEEDLKDFPEGAVFVAHHTSPKFVTIMNKASAIITDVGSATGHMASLSREYQIPTILDTEISTRILRDGQEITVDAIHCNIYEGKVEKLLEYARKKKEPFKETHLFKKLKKVLQWIVPLNLTDPDNEYFKSEYCKTFHDITRFAHEIAMYEMFSTVDDSEIDGVRTIDLSAGIPIGVHMLDIDGGIQEKAKKASLEDIRSLPFAAILKGMKSMRWPEPRPVDAKGFLGMMAHTASVPEGELYEMGKKSFCIVSRNYMNFSIRLGYHFSMIEAYIGENINDNYIQFFFKGGGASLDRRLRRVKLITEILKKMGFKVNIKEDVINAILTKYKQATIEEKLEIIGKLTAYTKQLDMVMFNDAVTDIYIEEFVKQYIKEPAIYRGTS